MSSTSCERVRKYRQKQKEADKYQELKEKNRINQRNFRARLSNDCKKDMLIKRRTQYRQNKENIRTSNSTSISLQLDQPNATNDYGPLNLLSTFTNKQTFGKAMKRVRDSLPSSPRKRKAVIAKLALEEGLLNISCKPRPNASLSDKQKETVITFFNNDTISYQSPGMKEYVIQREQGQKIKLQKRYLLMTIQECYGIFRKENPDLKIGKSKFASLRPVHIILRSNIPHNVCVCKIHENVRLLLEALYRKEIIIYPDFQSLLQNVVCSQESHLCMTGQCKNCPKFNILDVTDDQANESVHWDEWESNDDKIQKVRKDGSVDDCIENLKTKLPEFLRHTMVKREQSKAFKTMKDNLSEGNLLIQIDFAENYTCQEQHEIQAAHWNHKQITIFTAVVWYKDYQAKKIQSFAIVSDFLNHDKFAVYVFLKKILSEMAKKLKITSVHFFSDGAASQFKQKYTISGMTYLSKQYNIPTTTWDFFATSHGKGAVDGIGGEVKRQARLASLAGTKVQSAADFVKVVKKHTSNISVIFVPFQEIEDEKLLLNARWDNTVAIPNTRKLHSIKCIDENEIESAEYHASIIWLKHAFVQRKSLRAKSRQTCSKTTKKSGLLDAEEK